ncbi:MAG: hypothetical protein ACMUEL_00785 [Flavobacteriales bacterium Tduv]
MIHWKVNGKEIRKIYKKGQGLKGQFSYTGISLFTVLLLSNRYHHQ